ncbi:hypothetical protein [Salininema proteolyticum]|uniref:Uncharacterized protein n=1 Tax=Salininema proteolyticum TaxID=1607685 RepID=A0ABV8U4N1_9ACTN
MTHTDLRRPSLVHNLIDTDADDSAIVAVTIGFFVNLVPGGITLVGLTAYAYKQAGATLFYSIVLAAAAYFLSLAVVAVVSWFIATRGIKAGSTLTWTFLMALVLAAVALIPMELGFEQTINKVAYVAGTAVIYLVALACTRILAQWVARELGIDRTGR